MARPTNERNAPLATWEDTFKEWTRIQDLGSKASAAETAWFADATQSISSFADSDPDRFTGMVKSVFPDMDATKLLGAIKNVPGADSIGNILSSVSSRAEKTVGTTERTGTTVSYVDLPTPEEFLDDFSDAYNIHIAGMVQTGGIRPEVAAFARSQPQMQAVFANYLRERVGRLLKGEPLWKVVGTEANNQLIGARTGEQSDVREIGSEATAGTTTQSSSVTASAKPTEAAPAGTVAPSIKPIASTIQFDKTAPAPVPSTSESLQYSENKETDLARKTREQEALVSRNKLWRVANLAPLDFLKDAATAQSLNMVYEGEKGTARRAAETATGGESLATRRI
jgi:hypothetical protein